MGKAVPLIPCPMPQDDDARHFEQRSRSTLSRPQTPELLSLSRPIAALAQRKTLLKQALISLLLRTGFDNANQQALELFVELLRAWLSRFGLCYKTYSDVNPHVESNRILVRVLGHLNVKIADLKSFHRISGPLDVEM